MSNLGLYQTITTFTKKVGGPKKAIFLVMGGGYVVFRSGEALIKKTFKEIKKLLNSRKETQEVMVKESGISNEGVKFEKGIKVRICAIDGDAVLVEKSDEPDVPYYVSKAFLHEISDYKCGN